MMQAIKEAKKSLRYGDVPIGAIIVANDKIISRGYNQIEKKGSPLLHAEIIAIEKATKKLSYKHLYECTLYVTLEPCAMCSGAIVLSRIKRLVYGAKDPKTGAAGSLYNIPQDKRLNHRLDIQSGVCDEQCSEIIKQFFKNIREKKR